MKSFKAWLLVSFFLEPVSYGNPTRAPFVNFRFGSIRHCKSVSTVLMCTPIQTYTLILFIRIFANRKTFIGAFEYLCYTSVASVISSCCCRCKLSAFFKSQPVAALLLNERQKTFSHVLCSSFRLIYILSVSLSQITLRCFAQ